jgi:hypothetical protein
MSAALEADEMSRHARKSLAKGKRPKAKLGLPDLDHSKSAVSDTYRQCRNDLTVCDLYKSPIPRIST